MITAEREAELKRLAIAVCANPRSTAKELAESAGISKATFYRVYSSRENLVEILNDRTRAMVEELMTIVRQRDKSPRDVLHEFILKSCENKEYLIRICYSSAAGCDDSCTDRYVQEVTDFFLWGQKEGAFRIDLPASVISELFGGSMLALFEGEQTGRIASMSLSGYWETFFLQGVENSERGDVK